MLIPLMFLLFPVTIVFTIYPGIMEPRVAYGGGGSGRS